MSNLWKGWRRISADRTGMPSPVGEEELWTFENPKTAWLIVVVVFVAVAALLQMETDRTQLGIEKKALIGRSASTFLGES